MIDSENDTGVPPKEPRAPLISGWDILIPAALFVSIAGLLFLAFEKESSEPPKSNLFPLSTFSTVDLLKLERTAEVATELLVREEVSLEIADACLRRLATLQGKPESALCDELIQQLPEWSPKTVQERWVVLISRHSDPGEEQRPSGGKVARAILLASDLQKSPSSIPKHFRRATTTLKVQSLLRAICIVQNPAASESCLQELHRLIITPACAAPETADQTLILAAIDSVAEMKVDAGQKSNVFCELAIAGICRAACFRALGKLPLRTISNSHRGPLAASLLDYLAVQRNSPQTITDVDITSFSESLVNVFRGESRERYARRLNELRQRSLSDGQ